MARVAETAAMKIKILLIVVSTCFILDSALGQGALTPPGAPAPTMRTLDQLDAKLEKRTPISAVPFTISQPGSYYLTTNVTTAFSNAIVITASGVTLDLGGWTIASTVPNAANGGVAILLANKLSDITIVNGHIRSGVTNNGSGAFFGSGFSSGIYAAGINPVNARVSGVSVSGCLNQGIYLGSGDTTQVESCTVRTIGDSGISATTVKNSVAADCGQTGIAGVTVSDSQGAGISGSGISATTAQNCNSSSSGGGYGLFCTTAQNCNATSNSSYGIYAFGLVINCQGQSNSGTGITAFTANSCRGISSTGTGLAVAHNVNSF